MVLNQNIARKIAKEFRRNKTTTEKLLWEKLRKKQFLGLKFLQQHPIFYKINDHYRFFIADFYCHEKRLIIEVDGSIHHKQQEYDQKRSEILSTKNYKIIRLSNDDVENNINSILIRLKKEVDNL